jgi:hypothetical protein
VALYPQSATGVIEGGFDMKTVVIVIVYVLLGLYLLSAFIGSSVRWWLRRSSQKTLANAQQFIDGLPEKREVVLERVQEAGLDPESEELAEPLAALDRHQQQMVQIHGGMAHLLRSVQANRRFDVSQFVKLDRSLIARATKEMVAWHRTRSRILKTCDLHASGRA